MNIYLSFHIRDSSFFCCTCCSSICRCDQLFYTDTLHRCFYRLLSQPRNPSRGTGMHRSALPSLLVLKRKRAEFVLSKKLFRPSLSSRPVPHCKLRWRSRLHCQRAPPRRLPGIGGCVPPHIASMIGRFRRRRLLMQALSPCPCL